MSSCRFCTHFQRVNFILPDKYINNVEGSNTVTTTDYYYEASYFPVSDNNEAVAWGVCKKNWRSVKADFIKCDTFEYATVSPHLEDALKNQSNTKHMFNPSTQSTTTNIGLFSYYINNLCAKSISELKSQKHCVFCSHWAETYNDNIDIPPAYIPYFETQDRCLINTASQGICCISRKETNCLNICNCDNIPRQNIPTQNIPTFERRVIEARRKMRTLMRLEALYIIHSFPDNYEKGTENGYHMRMFNSYNITNALDKSSKFLNITPSLFRGRQESTYDTISDHITNPDSTRMHFNYTVIREFAQYYHVSEEYLLGYTSESDICDPDLLTFVLSPNNTLYDIFYIIKHLLPTNNTDIPKDVIMLLNEEPSLAKFFKPSIEDNETLEYVKTICKVDKLPIYKDLNRSLIYAVYLLIKSGKKNMIDDYIKSTKFKSDKLSKLLSLPTDERKVIKQIELNGIIPSEAFLIEIAALMNVLPADSLNTNAKKCLNKMVDADKRNKPHKVTTNANSVDERIRSHMSELDISKKTLCQKTRINPKTYEAKMTAYIQQKECDNYSINPANSKTTTEKTNGFNFKEFHQIASVLDCSITYLKTGESDYYEESVGNQSKIVRNPFEHITDEQADILNKTGILSNQLYICRILSNLFITNRFFTTVAIEYYRRGQPQKVIEYIRNLQNIVPRNRLDRLKTLRHGQCLDDLFKKND